MQSYVDTLSHISFNSSYCGSNISKVVPVLLLLVATADHDLWLSQALVSAPPSDSYLLME